MNNFGKNLALWVIIGLLLVALFNLFQQPSGRSGQSGIPFSEFLADVQGIGKTERTHAVNDAEIDGLGLSSRTTS